MPTFLYGTLQDDVLRARLVGRDILGVPAYLEHHQVVTQSGSYTPALVQLEDARCEGVLVTDLTELEKRRLDAYEAAFDYTVEMRRVIAGGHPLDVRVYIPGPIIEVTEELWSLETWQAKQGPLSRERATEIAQADPPLDADELRRQWKMIGSRAAARLRAAADDAPSEVRYAATPLDAEVSARTPMHGSFFKFQGFQMQHRTFHGTQSPVLDREVMIGVDASLVLPYDPVSDSVLLVEQIRTGPLMRAAANPWSLEPVAGMVDPGETPEEAAIRETEEEAGLTDVTLEEMFSCYASPGGATDYFYCYLALSTLPDLTTFTGGLAEEHEDLRLHVLPFDDAMTLIETGEANVGPLISMLLWLSRHRDRLRGGA